jgi:hypothetical protein
MSSEREYFEELREKVFAEAVAKGSQVVIPFANQLQLDIDRPWPDWLKSTESTNGNLICLIIHTGGKKMESVLNRFLLEIEVTKWEAWRSEGGNCHIMMTLRYDLDVMYRIALQSILGSDPMREFLNMRRVMCAADDPIALFKPPAK